MYMEIYVYREYMCIGRYMYSEIYVYMKIYVYREYMCRGRYMCIWRYMCIGRYMCIWRYMCIESICVYGVYVYMEIYVYREYMCIRKERWLRRLNLRHKEFPWQVAKLT